MARLDTIHIDLGTTEVEVSGYCTDDFFEIEDVMLNGVSVYDLIGDLESYGFDFAMFQEMANEECREYIDRVYNPENQI